MCRTEHSHKRLRKGKAVLESDDDEQMDESAPAEKAAPTSSTDSPASSEAQEGQADDDKSEEEGGNEEDEDAGKESAKGGAGEKARPSGAALPLKLKQASKAKGVPPKGSTAATIQYHKYDAAGAATWKAGESSVL